MKVLPSEDSQQPVRKSLPPNDAHFSSAALCQSDAASVPSTQADSHHSIGVPPLDADPTQAQLCVKY